MPPTSKRQNAEAIREMLQTADYALALSAGLASLERTHIALYGAPIAALAQGLTAVAETLRLSELVDLVAESCLAGGQDTFADCLYGGESGFELARRLAVRRRDGGPAVILISTYSAADFARPIAESPATGFLPKQQLSADAIRRIVDGRGPAGPPGAPAR